MTEADRCPERLAVNLAITTGPVHGGASGMLYGLSDVGVPAPALIAGARPHTIAQKAPRGLQHPNGDATVVASTFYDHGGENVLIYMQDVYSQWPYEQQGIDDYLAKVTDMVTVVSTRQDADRFHWVPFNEPDWIWYGDWSSDRERFLADWTAVYREIRRVLPEAVIVGPNEMHFNAQRVRDFLAFAKAHRVLPDVMSWHELTPPSLRQYPHNFAAYRELETSLGIGPLPLNINEYGSRRDLSNPGRLVQWIAMFEATKVDADMAYWTYAGNLDDHCVQTSQANGGWWLLKWYADLTGETVEVRVDQSTDVGLRGLAAWDDSRVQLTVLLGGTETAVAVEVEGLPLELGDQVDVALSSTSWSGYEGDAGSPPVRELARVAVVDGRVAFAVPGGDVTAAYQVVITPVEVFAGPVGAPGTTHYEAQHAELADVTVVSETDDPDEYFLSGGAYVDVMSAPTGSVTFTVTVPVTGVYTLGILYGTPGVVAQQALYLDGEFLRVLQYPATLNPTYRGRLDELVELAAGQHLLAVRASTPDGPLADREVSLDRLDLTVRVSVECSYYPARSARLSGGATLLPGSAERPAAAALDGGVATFFVAAREDGYHTVRVRCHTSKRARLAIAIDGRPAHRAAVDTAGEWSCDVIVHLGRGITALSVTGAGFEVTDVSLTRASAADDATVRIDVSELQLQGNAALLRDPYASSGVCVAGLGDGLGSVSFPRAGVTGEVNLTLGYANAAKNSASHYNTDVISAAIAITEAGGGSTSVWLRHSYSWSNFWTRVVPVTLQTADGALAVGATDGPGPTIDRIALSPLVLSAALRRVP